MTRRFEFVAAIIVFVALSQQGVAARSGSADQFGDITTRVQLLWKSDPCFIPSAVESIDACWKQSAGREQAAQSESLLLVAEFDSILATTPNYSASLQTKLNLLTKAGLFCNVPLAEPQQRAFWAKTYTSFYEYSNDLLICAKSQSDEAIYDQLRGAINNYIGRYSKVFQREFLKLWFDSYIRQFNKNGDLFIIAAGINDSQLDSWKFFVGHIRYIAVKYGRYPPRVSVEELRAARRILYSE